MIIEDGIIEPIRIRFNKLAWTLDERMRRLFAAAEASALGRGGIAKVAQATGVSRRAIHVGLRELSDLREPVENPSKRIRKEGAGRKSVIKTDVGLMSALEKLVEPMTRGDPESPLRWTCKSLLVPQQKAVNLAHQSTVPQYPRESVPKAAEQARAEMFY